MTALRGTRRGREHGGAVVEFALLVPLMATLIVSAIDIGRLVHTRQIALDVTRAAAALPVRGLSASEALAVARSIDPRLPLSSTGSVVVTTVARKSVSDATPWVVEQVESGSTSDFRSRVGVTGGPANLGDVAALQPGMKLTAVEIAVPFKPAFSFGADFYPSTIYSVAYF